eukprot:3350203-Prymnesium_polylepis.2
MRRATFARDSQKSAGAHVTPGSRGTEPARLTAEGEGVTAGRRQRRARTAVLTCPDCSRLTRVVISPLAATPVAARPRPCYPRSRH